MDMWCALSCHPGVLSLNRPFSYIVLHIKMPLFINVALRFYPFYTETRSSYEGRVL